MNAKERLDLFSEELNWFSTTAIRNFAFHCLSKLPEYFFHIPASASGRYHPAYSLGEGGLVRHTKAAMRIFHNLMQANIPDYYPNDRGLDYTQLCDACLLALLVHDGFKLGNPSDYEATTLGEEAHTEHAHPLISAEFLLHCIPSFLDSYDIDAGDLPIIHEASAAVSSHMGIWTISSHSSVVLPSPKMGDWASKLVHLCDYLASRKDIQVDLSVNEPHI